MKILITGSTGFLGSHIAELLVEQGHNLLLTKREKSDLWRCDTFVNKAEWINTDKKDWQSAAVKFSPEVIVNCAWDGVGVDGRSNWFLQVHNIEFQQQLLDIAVKSNCGKFIGIGSQAEYGEFNGVINETDTVNPNSAYGATKLASQIVLKTFCEMNNMNWYWFRLFSTYGEREGDNWLIPSVIKNMQQGSSMDFTMGEQRYAYLYIGEVAKAIITAATMQQAAPSGVYNISSDKTISIKELLEIIRDEVNPHFKLNFGALPYRQGQSMLMQGNNYKICRYIYTLKTDDIGQKLKQTIRSYR